MNTILFSAIDARQTPEWGIYLQQIGWIPKQIDNTLVLIRTLKPLPWSMIKILHPKGPLPFTKIDELAQKYNSLLVIIEPHVYKYDEYSFKENGYRFSKMRYAHTATIKIDLKQSEEELFNSFSENAKRNIKKSLKAGIYIKTVDLSKEKNNKKFDMFYKLLLNLSTMKKFYIPPYEEYIKKMTAFKKTSLLLFAYKQGSDEPLASVWFAHYDNVISYLQTGISQSGYDTFANYLLVWEGLKVAKKLDLEVFDFETIYDPRYPKDHPGWKGYTIFKKKFHGEIIEYPPSWIKMYNPVFKLFYLCTSIFMN
jgi:lipid II:glycine glycyltransferase (peptidoglycan interpeptide bridge formation enzyme)